MRRFLADPSACAVSGNAVLRSLMFGWGNLGWAAGDEYLVSCIEEALHTDGPILECGSGLSTLLVGGIASQRNLPHWVLEHTQDWAGKVQGYLDRYKLQCVTLKHAPLIEYGEFNWYDAPLDMMPSHFALVVCDGPPADTKGGRYGLGSVMRNRLHPGTIILLDDGGRPDEMAIAERWKHELGATFELHGVEKPYIRMKL